MKLPLACFLMAEVLARAANTLPPELQGIGIDQRLGAHLPLNTVFRNEDGREITLGSLFQHRPVLLALVYYTCPMLCDRILHGVVAGLRPLNLTPGRDFDLVAISFNPSETPEDAKAKKEHYSKLYSRKLPPDGWHFLVGSPESIKAVTEAAGFHYRWDPKTKMFIHASGVMIATPDGRMSRYLYGIEYEPKDLKLGLVESSNGSIASPVDKILLFCYHYDPSSGKYTTTVLNLLRAAALLTLIVLGTLMWLLWSRERRPAWKR